MKESFEIALDPGSNGWAVINHLSMHRHSMTVIDRGLSYDGALKLAEWLNAIEIAPPANENC